MNGNVWQWCQDRFGADYYGKSPSDDPTGPPGGSHRVIRGGAWFGSAGICRSAYRYYYVPGHRDHNLGFRVSQVLAEK